MSKEEYKYSDITGKIMGCSMRVHGLIRNDYREVIYHRGLIAEFKKNNLSFSNEMELLIFYDDIEVGKRRIDFLIEDKVIVEIKALSTSLEVKRLINSKHRPSYKSGQSV